jgi:hypothetical protein
LSRSRGRRRPTRRRRSARGSSGTRSTRVRPGPRVESATDLAGSSTEAPLVHPHGAPCHGLDHLHEPGHEGGRPDPTVTPARSPGRRAPAPPRRRRRGPRRAPGRAPRTRWQHHRPHVGPGGGEHRPRPVEVGAPVPQRVGPRLAHPHPGGQVTDGVGAQQRRGDDVGIEHRARHRTHPVGQPARVACEPDHLVAAREQRVRHRRPDEAACSGDHHAHGAP